MRVLSLAFVLAALLAVSGCDQNQSPSPTLSNRPASTSNGPAPANSNRPAIDVHAPNVDVKSDKEGTSVTTPGADIHVQKKQP